MGKRVCIDPGHGGVHPGAVYRGLQEKDIVLKVAKFALEALSLSNPNVWVRLTRVTDQTVTLQQRCDVSNTIRADCFVSIHCNADPDFDEPGMPEAKGEEIWVHKGSREGIRLAQCLRDGVDKIFPNEPFRGIKETIDLYVLKRTNAPACLVEIGFIDKSSSNETFTDNLTLYRIGELIAGGINEYLSLNG